MKTWHWILIAVVVLGGGAAVYFFTRPKKTPAAVAANTPPATSTRSPLQQFESDSLGFAFDEGKKALSNLFG